MLNITSKDSHALVPQVQKKRVTLMSMCFGSLALKPLMMFPNDSAALPPPSGSLQPAEGVLTFQSFAEGES